MRVLMLPTPKQMRSEESGIRRVVEAYYRYLPDYGIEFAEEKEAYELKAVHAGTNVEGVDVCHSHGLYWTADLNCSGWEWKVNSRVIETMRQAKIITCPSEWVAESIRRDMRRQPVIIGHGIDWEEWQHDGERGNFVLWNKNRKRDVCDPSFIGDLASAYSNVHFVTTFPPQRRHHNISDIGLVPHDQMKQLVQGAGVYLSTAKETFGIGILEAMASGVPVLGFAHGGNLELVEHGVNGYLAEPNDVEGLIEGLDYCLHHREVLGENGRELAKQYTWQRACEQVADVYEKALKPEPATAAIIIPSYNYADKVGRAIESAVRQGYELLTEIIVVDDGSEDSGETERVAQEWHERDNRVRFHRQENSGVAVARNEGIRRTAAKYVCCLDADDALEPEFMERCVRALERDRSLGIAYTGLRYVLPDGQTGPSPWPGEWNFDAQLQRKNQVPTCCVFRRDMWEALGGYKKRYAPEGAGQEDAEFWTRAGAYGWKAEKVTAETLFVYSWRSGRVSGNKEHREVDWLAFHPWAYDGLHPFASYATPRRFSHPVRQYDEPVVSIIIPVGPGHEEVLEDALDSVEAQTFRKWEAIVVWDGGLAPERLYRAYPHVRWAYTKLGEKPSGAGAARNVGAKLARAPFLLFLDADDWLYPEAVEKMLEEWQQEEAIIYTDYVGKAFIDDVSKLAPKLQERILWRMGDGLTAIRYHADDYDPARGQRQPDEHPWVWCNISSLLPKAWHDEIEGFDEKLESWEDVDYWWRLSKAGKCFRRIEEPLLVYHFYSGGRRDIGAERHKDLLGYLREKYKEIEIMGCAGCGGRRVAPAAGRGAQAPRATLSDEEFKLCVYRHPNRGQHPVVGQAAFGNRLEGVHMVKTKEGWKIHYGFRAGGDKFLVHKEDIKIAGHLFDSLDGKPQPPKPEPREIAAPEPIAVDLGGEEVQIDLAEPLPAPKRIDVQAVMQGPPPEPVLTSVGGLEELDEAVEAIQQREAFDEMLARRQDEFDPQKLPGVTHKVADQMRMRGINSLVDILDLGLEGLEQFDYVGKVRAQTIFRAAQEAARDYA